MMKCFIISILIFYAVPNFAQQKNAYLYDRDGNLIAGTHIKTVPPVKVVLKDTVKNYNIVLDSSHVFISAFNNKNEMLWKTDPWKDNKIDTYRTRRPIIVDMFLGNNRSYVKKKKDAEKVIWINYNNTQFGFIDIKTGAYHFCGQD